jgi:hypothetical protein
MMVDGMVGALDVELDQGGSWGSASADVGWREFADVVVWEPDD